MFPPTIVAITVISRISSGVASVTSQSIPGAATPRGGSRHRGTGSPSGWTAHGEPPSHRSIPQRWLTGR